MMKKLTSGFLALGMLLTVGFTNAKAQDEITDQDIKDYAVIQLATQSILRSVNPWVQSYLDKYNEAQSAPEFKISTERWAELEATGGDNAKLGKINANAGEIDITKKIVARVEKKQKAAEDVLKLLASNGLGASKYNALKSAVKSDPDVKAKFNEYVASLQ